MSIQQILSSYPRAAAGEDPYWGNVSLLLHMDGADGSTSFPDSSSSGRIMTAVGGAQVSTARKEYGSGSLYLNNNGYLQTPITPNLQLLSELEFTFETSIYIEAMPDTNGATSFSAFQLGVPESGIFTNCCGLEVHVDATDIKFLTFFYFDAGGSVTGHDAAVPFSVPWAGDWIKLAMVRDASGVRYYLNGKVINPVTNTVPTTPITLSGSGYLTIGGTPNVTYPRKMRGNVDEWRLTPGECRITGDTYIPSTGPFPNS